MKTSKLYSFENIKETSTGSTNECVYFHCPFCLADDMEVIFRFNDIRVDYGPLFHLSLAVWCNDYHLSILHLQNMGDRTHVWIEKVADMHTLTDPEVTRCIEQTGTRRERSLVPKIKELIADHLKAKVSVDNLFVKYE